jgi:hypothetical protein
MTQSHAGDARIGFYGWVRLIYVVLFVKKGPINFVQLEYPTGPEVASHKFPSGSRNALLGNVTTQ